MFKKILTFSVLVSLLGACTPKTGTVTQTSPVPDLESFRKTAPKAGPAPTIQLGDYQSFTLDNGLKVILVEKHQTPAITFSLSIDVPPTTEGEKTGTAELMGNLLGTGTKSNTKAEIDERVDFIGATLSAYSKGIYGNSLTKHKDELLTLMSDILLNPSFPDLELQKIKKQTLSSLAQAKDNADAIASNIGDVLNYGKNHPYGEIMTEKTVESISREDCINYYNRFFKPNAAYLVVTGDISLKELKTVANKYFGTWKKGSFPKVTVASVKAPAAASIALVNKPGAVQSKILITYPVDLKPNSSDRIKARVANALLGGFFGSRLNKNLREDKAYTYGARSALHSDRYVGYFLATAKVRNEVTDSAIIQFMKEMNRIVSEKPSETELKRVKSVLAGQFARSMENDKTIARFALNTMKYNLPKDYYANYLKNLNAVTSDDILAMAKKYIRPNNAHIVVVGNKDDVNEKLQAIAPGGRLELLDIQGNKLKASAHSIEGMTPQKVIDNYIKAIGEKARSIHTLKVTAEAEMQGQKMSLTFWSTDSDKSRMEMLMNGTTVQTLIYNNGKGSQTAGRRTQPLGPGQLNGVKTTGVPIKELMFEKLGIKTELKSIENVNGQEAYKLIATAPTGNQTIMYYSTTSGLKIQEIADQQGTKITSTLDDYKEVDGVLFPHTMTQYGIAPTPLVFKTVEIKLNDSFNGVDFSVK